jgi:hypothetical protein
MISKFIVKSRFSVFDVAIILLALSALESRAYLYVVALAAIWFVLGRAIKCYSEA